MKLYEIPYEARAIEDMIESAEGEITPEIDERVKAFMSGGKEKLEQAACVVRSLTSQAEACGAEAERLQMRKRSLENNVERLKGYMLMAVDAGFDGKVKTDLFTIWGQTSVERPEFKIKDGFVLEDLPYDCVRRTVELNKQALNEAWKRGTVPRDYFDVTVVPGKRGLRIK